MSLDGFIARSDHSLDWLDKQHLGGEDHGYDAFFASVDGLVMGRSTFETVLGFVGHWPYSKPVVVMSRSLSQEDIPEALRDRVRLTHLAPRALMDSLYDEGWSRAYVDGGQVVQSFLRARLIDEMTITVIPILIGEGRPLFGPLEADIDLELLGSTPFASGLVQHSYKLV